MKIYIVTETYYEAYESGVIGTKLFRYRRDAEAYVYEEIQYTQEVDQLNKYYTTDQMMYKITEEELL